MSPMPFFFLQNRSEWSFFQLGPVFFSKYSLCMIREGRHLSKTEVSDPSSSLKRIVWCHIAAQLYYFSYLSMNDTHCSTLILVLFNVKQVPFPDFFLCAFTRELSIASAGCLLDQQWAGRPQPHAASHDVMHALALFVNLGRPLWGGAKSYHELTRHGCLVWLSNLPINCLAGVILLPSFRTGERGGWIWEGDQRLNSIVESQMDGSIEGPCSAGIRVQSKQTWRVQMPHFGGSLWSGTMASVCLRRRGALSIKKVGPVASKGTMI